MGAQDDFHKSVLDLEYDNLVVDGRVVIAKAEGAEFAATPTGSFTEKMLTWNRGDEGRLEAGALERVVVLKTGGDCTSFDVEVRDKAAGTLLHVVYEVLGVTTSHDKSLIPILFVTHEIGDKRGFIWLAIKPVGGTSGTFIAMLVASARR